MTLSGSEMPPSVITNMTDALHHRGPDDVGYYRDSFVSLGHRRLSIVDLATGHQPMFNETGNLCIIFNGEIFNHAEIRPLLEGAGHRYATRSDTETILHAYEEYGPECVKRFRGMFTFAILDRVKRSLFCARDRLGIKPFYYYWDGRLFAFASEIKSLLCHPNISAKVDRALLPQYLAFGYLSDDRTLFAGIRKLMPGHRLTLTTEGLQVEQYWDVPPRSTIEDHDDELWIRECRRRLEETVRMRLMADVPLGMFLSGGVDSSAIAALMARMVQGRVKTFSVGYGETAYTELPYARQVAQAIGTDHHEVTVTRDDFFNVLPALIWHEDEPIAWPSSVPLYYVSKLAAQSVKVVLSGEGADELFGGYARYRFFRDNEQWMKRYAHLPAGLRRNLRLALQQTRLLPAGARRKVQHTLLGREPNFESFFLDNFYSAFSLEEQEELLGAQSPEAESAYAPFVSYWNGDTDPTVLSRLLYADQKTYLVELLMRQDQMSMASSIESRVPFLDHPFVEFAAGVPDRLKIRKREGKYILKRAVADLLPNDIIYRRKMGFPTPLRDWLRQPETRSLLGTLRNPKGFVSQFLNRPPIEALLEQHVSGRIDATDRLWRLLNLELWGQMFISGTRRVPHLAEVDYAAASGPARY